MHVSSGREENGEPGPQRRPTRSLVEGGRGSEGALCRPQPCRLCLTAADGLVLPELSPQPSESEQGKLPECPVPQGLSSAADGKWLQETPTPRVTLTLVWRRLACGL